jgi:Na+/proline symporter
VFYEGRAFERSDEIFALFLVQELPPGLTGLLIAGVFAAAMSSLSSSINSLASASAYDFWAPLVGAEGDEGRTLRAGRGFTLLWSALLIGGAILFIPLSQGTTAVEVALGIASVVYGGLLGGFALARLSQRADQRSAILGMTTGIGVVLIVQQGGAVAWPWFVLIGALVTLTVGHLLGRGGKTP